jgi:hypothetical protein
MTIFSRFFRSAPRRIRVRNYDAAPRTTTARDTLITAGPAPTPADLGDVWDGNVKAGASIIVAALKGIKDRARQRDALRRVQDVLTEYGNRLAQSTASNGPAGSIVFSESHERPPEFRLERAPSLGPDPEFDVAPYVGAGASPNDIAEANADYWNPRKTTDSTRSRPTLRSCATTAGMQDALNKHWASANGGPRPMTTRDAAALGRSMQRAPNMADRIAAINAANAGFWDRKPAA